MTHQRFVLQIKSETTGKLHKKVKSAWINAVYTALGLIAYASSMSRALIGRRNGDWSIEVSGKL